MCLSGRRWGIKLNSILAERSIKVGYVQGTRWTDELIEQEILRVREALNLDRMPTNSEVKSVVEFR